ncbi:hypothetical protein SteCoe_2157 [Stentor coeruleus]|uniref:C1q domain-containing protein n=1 Tax=Stentor coeruleus TaxID=5963 RepID=A0A1R2D068_9CILI|nr:hypothetical protein SteCoe_2157 [Stentor coeruleus]
MASIRSSSPNRSNYDISDPLQPSVVEELLKGQIEWRNIQDIIRVSFRALTDTVKNQAQAIRDIERIVSNKVSKSEFHSSLAQKLDYTDFSENLAHVKASLENKTSRFEVESLVLSKVNDINYELSSKAPMQEVLQLAEEHVQVKEFATTIDDLYTKLDMVHEEINHMLQILPSQKDLNEVKDISNLKITELTNTLRGIEENHDELISKKLNRTEFESALARKNEEIKSLHLAVEVKAEAEWTETTFRELKSLIVQGQKNYEALQEEIKALEDKNSECWDESQKQLESLKNDFEASHNELSSNVALKADNKELEKAINLMHKKADTDTMHEHFTIQRKQTNESLNDKISDVKTILKRTEDGFLERIKTYEEYSKQLENSIKDAKHVLKMLESEHKTVTKETVSNFTKELEDIREDLKLEINKVLKTIEDVNIEKATKDEFKDIMGKVNQKLNGKADISDFDKSLQKSQKELVASFQTIRDDYKIYFTKLENQMSAKFDQLISRNELRQALSEKADNSQVSRLISTKLNLEEIVKLRSEIEVALSEIRGKATKNELDSHVASTKIAIEEISKELMSKAYIKDICTLLDMKASIDDVNSALVEIHKELDTKISTQEHNVHLNEQQALNSILCSENSIGRWIWRNGQLANGFAVPWEIQCINTSPDNFIWEIDATNILVVSPGLYEITFGFYCKKKPTVQLLVNGETILSAVNNASYVIHHSSGRLKNASSSSGTISGLTLIDFIALPPRAKISISYNGDRSCEGFLSLRKL